MPADDIPAKKRERAPDMAADLGGLLHGRHGGRLHDAGELDDLVKLRSYRQRVVDALAAGLEDRLLMNRFGGMRNRLA